MTAGHLLFSFVSWIVSQRASGRRLAVADNFPLPAKIAWIRTALSDARTPLGDDAIVDAIAHVERRNMERIESFNDLIVEFDRIKSRLNITSAAGPYTGQAINEFLLGPQLGNTRWSQVYLSRNKDAVVKVYKTESNSVAHEAHVQSIAYEKGVSVPPVLAIGLISAPTGIAFDYLVMGWARGKSLVDRSYWELTPEARQSAATGIVYNVVLLLSLGIVNWDQGSNNIMVTDSGEVTLIDFALARIQDEISREKFLAEAKEMIAYAFVSLGRAVVRRELQEPPIASHFAAFPDDLKSIFSDYLKSRLY